MFSILTKKAKTHYLRERRTIPLPSMAPDDASWPAVDPDRFQPEDGTWPGHWAPPPRPWQRPECRLLSLEAREDLRHALPRLPERQCLIVGLRDVSGLSAAEVCDLLDISRENQRVLLHRGRSRLRSELGPMATRRPLDVRSDHLQERPDGDAPEWTQGEWSAA